jgi:AcrR family transcriptional regulator
MRIDAMPRQRLQQMPDVRVARDDSSAHSSAHLLPRKTPKQGRSIALVDALKTACLRILVEEGAAELTSARLADVSGVSTASIYEYFPHLDSLVAEVLRETIREAALESCRVSALPPDTPLLELLGHLVRRAFEKRAYLAGLHSQVYLRHIEYFEAISPSAMEQVLERYSAVITLHDKRLAALVVTNALAQLAQTLLQQDPLSLRSPETQRMVVRMLHAALVDPEHGMQGASSVD